MNAAILYSLKAAGSLPLASYINVLELKCLKLNFPCNDML